MFELLFLLLPFAAAYGYYMGRQSVRDKKEKSSTVRNNNYLRGVEYLLNNEKDRAVDKFIAYLNESDPSLVTVKNDTASDKDDSNDEDALTAFTL